MYTLYITNDCPACDRVIDSLKSGTIDIAIVNISDPGKERPKLGVSVFPALFKINRLIAYGDDIIKKLSPDAEQGLVIKENQIK